MAVSEQREAEQAGVEQVPGGVQSALLTLTRWLFTPQTWAGLLVDTPLTLTDAQLIITLGVEGPIRGTDLAALRAVDRSTIAIQLRRLDTMGLVAGTHSATDRRVVTWELTAAGRAAHALIRRRGEDAIASLMVEWPDADRAALATLLSRLAAATRAR